jgi:hypothetical protein
VGSNFGFYSNPSVTALIAKGASAASASAVATIWAQADQAAMKDAPFYPIVDPSQPLYHASYVHNAVYVPAPVGLEQAVSAVPRDEHRFHPGFDRAGQPGQRGQDSAGSRDSELGQVVTSQPELARVTGVAREHHHAAGNAPHLAQPGDRVLPVMNGANSHRGVEGLVIERQVLGRSSQARRRVREALRTRERRRFLWNCRSGGLYGRCPWFQPFRVTAGTDIADRARHSHDPSESLSQTVPGCCGSVAGRFGLVSGVGGTGAWGRFPGFRVEVQAFAGSADELGPVTVRQTLGDKRP